MGLATYLQKRDFTKSPEPRGELSSKPGFGYFVQMHDASHLHFDFRLELDGVLKSWAVPKGPSLDPSIKRLAVEVEDHPVEYGSFEGTIPPGEYGGGTVMLWDRGTWQPKSDPASGIQRGKLEFELHGERLKGEWILLRTARKASKPQWLLIKRHDDEAKPEAEFVLADAFPNSVATDRTMEEIASGKKVNQSKLKTSTKKRSDKVEEDHTSAKSRPKSNHVAATPVKFPPFIQPQLATLVNEPPDGANWFHEIKFDGYRMQCHVQNGKAKIFTRNGNDWTAKLPEITRALGALPFTNGILDGELVSPRADGSTDFQSLQNAFRDKQTQSLIICFFDLMFLDGTSLVNASLAERKTMLEKLLDDLPSNSPLQYSRHIVGEGAAYARKAAELGLEGIVCKNAKSKYRSGRGKDWLKVKMIHKEEFVIGGYTAPEGSRVGLGALLVGYYDNEDRLRYAGKVGTGFEQKTLKMLESKLRVIRENRSPFDVTSSGTNAPPKSMWVKPELVAQIRYGSLTRDRILRHAVFEGLREDKPANEVELDKPVEVEEVAAETKAKKPSKVNGGVESKTRQRSVPFKASSSSKDMFDGVRLTSQNKILDPQSQISKLDLATYYRDMSEWILPHIHGRPLVLVRCPQGIQDACFYQKHPVAGTPSEIRQIQIEEKTETDTYVIVDNAKGLVSLAQVGAMELHAWGSTEKNIERPDRLVFDLDPDPTVEWRQVIEAAKKIKGLLEQLELKSFVKTTGGKGLHIVVPIDRRNTWEEAKLFSKLIAQFIQSDKPDRYTLNMSKAERSGKIFIDYLRNERGATSVVAYSPRARPGTPVSTPLAWDELSARIRSDGFNTKSIESRLSQMSVDPWQDLFTTRQSIGTALKQLQSVLKENSSKAKRAK